MATKPPKDGFVQIGEAIERPWEAPAADGALARVRHEKFCQEVASGKGPSDAYRLAGFPSTNAKSISVSASRLFAQPKIQARVQEILGARELLHGQSTAVAIEKAALSKTWIIERLVENANRAMQAVGIKDSEGEPTGEYRYEGSVANRALELLGKEVGMFVDRREVGKPGEFVKIEEMSVDELRDFIATGTTPPRLRENQTTFAGGGGAAGGKPH